MKKQILLLSLIAGLVFNLQSKPKNFVVIIADDVSACDITTYGNEFVNTHNIDNLAKQGVVFDKAYLTASSCSPSRSSILTSRYPHNLGDGSELHRSIPLHLSTLSKQMKDNGYFTIRSGKPHFGGSPTAKKITIRDFDINDDRKIGGDVFSTGSGNWVDCLRKVPKDKAFFAWFASFDAHRPWDDFWIDEIGEKLKPEDVIVPPELVDDKATREDLAAYYNEIKRFDHRLGEVVKELERQGKLEETFIVVLADNGRAFPRAKTRTSNEIGGKAIIIVYCPSYTDYKGVRTSSLVSTIDIAPTILDIAGIDIPESFQGVSFSSILKDKNAETRDFVFAEQNWHDFSAHVRTVRYKDFSYTINARPEKALMPPTDVLKSDCYRSLVELINSGAKLNPMQADMLAEPRASEEFYVIPQDEHQLINEIANPEYADVVKKMKAAMIQWQAETGDSVPENYSKDRTGRDFGLEYTDLTAPPRSYYKEAAGVSNKADLINNKGIYKE